jgi:hypothetical protein
VIATTTAFANVALARLAKDPTKVVDPAHKVLGDAAARWGSDNAPASRARIR